MPKIQGLNLPKPDKYHSEYYWIKYGGNPQNRTIMRVKEQLEASPQWKKMEAIDNLSADGFVCNHGNIYTNGTYKLEIHVHIGVTKADNSFSISMRRIQNG